MRRHYTVLLPLLFIPLHYAACATPVLYTKYVNAHYPVHDRGAEQTISHPDPVHLDIYSTRRLPAPEAQSLLDPAAPTTVSFQSRWNTYIASHCLEWISIITSAGAVAAASLTILQIADIKDHPITVFLVYLAIFRAIAAVAHGLCLLLYFRQAQLKSRKFASIWVMYARENSSSLLYAPWTILAFPAVCLSWAVLFLVVALFHHTWESAFSFNLLELATSQGVQPWMTLAPPVIITAFTAVDVACIVWVVKTMQKLKNRLPSRSSSTVSIPRDNDYTSQSFPS